MAVKFIHTYFIIPFAIDKSMQCKNNLYDVGGVCLFFLFFILFKYIIKMQL